jgi:hypothetical protein
MNADGPIIPFESVFDRNGSTLGVMDDLQIAVRTYDGCPRGCSGCLVDKDTKNRARGKLLLSAEELDIVRRRAASYLDWAKENLNEKETGYFGRNGHKIAHSSFTCRFGNHSELPAEQLIALAEGLDSNLLVLSTGPTDDLSPFIAMRDAVPGRRFLEIIYDPVTDDPKAIRAMILSMRAEGFLGYPEIVVTRQLVDRFSPERFVTEKIAPMGDIGAQIQFGRYSPSKTRAFSLSQAVPIDEEVIWLAGVAAEIVRLGLDVHPIPLGEYAVTLLDEYGEMAALGEDGIDESRLPEPDPFDPAGIREKTRDILLSSLYVDRDLSLHVWSESMGQHVLDSNFGYPALGNLRDASIEELVTKPGGGIDRMLAEIMRSLSSHPKCLPCRYKSFCASHAIPLFRKRMPDDGTHCYGYLPVIRAFQKDLGFLRNMIDGFKRLGF